ncbi:MAG: TonB family protein [Candidatus Lambdaproteobacteria bacterium]|nr:TonB family protein [Candidatus Lambdaproteobacteria bacterium]
MITKAARHAKAVPWAACTRWAASVALALAPLAALQWCDPVQRPAPPVLHLELTHLPAADPALDGAAAADPAAAQSSATSAAEPAEPPAADVTRQGSGGGLLPEPDAAAFASPAANEAPSAPRDAAQAVVPSWPRAAAAREPVERLPGAASGGSAAAGEPPLQAALGARLSPAQPRSMPAPERPQPQDARQDAPRAVTEPDADVGTEGVPLAGAASLDGNFRLLSLGALTYPPRARRLRIAGEARLELEIGADGRVWRVQVLSESGDWGFGAAARAAYALAAFTPPTVGGRPVRVLWRKTLQFRP